MTSNATEGGPDASPVSRRRCRMLIGLWAGDRAPAAVLMLVEFALPSMGVIARYCSTTRGTGS